MSNTSAASPVFSPGQARSPITTSTATTEKYPASGASDYNNYPEVAPSMNQPALEHYHQQNTAYNQPQYQYPNGYAAPEAGQPVPEKQKRNPWGLSPLAFGLLVAVITAAVVGGAVGGGVAGAMSGKDDSSSPTATVTFTTTTTPTATSINTGSVTSSALPLPSSLQNYVAPEPLYIDTLNYPGCTGNNGKMMVQYNTSFDLFCALDMNNNLPDETNPDLVVADVVGIFAYSIEDCLYACANSVHFNTQWADTWGSSGCKGVTWQSEMAANNASNSANCWLKNGTTSGYQSNNAISAKLST